MLLKDYLESKDIPPYKFAKIIGMAHSSIYLILQGKRRVSVRYAVEIEKATDGIVSRAEAVWPENYIKEEPDSSLQMIF